MPSLDSKLNLILPCDTHLGEVYAFSTPISYGTFKRYYRVMARTWSIVVGLGGGVSGPKVATMELEQTARDMNVWEGEAGVERGLVAEIRRLTNVVVPAEGGGWEPVPLMHAVQSGVLTEEDLQEIEGCLTFFMLAGQMQDRKLLETTRAGMSYLWQCRFTSLDCSAWIASSLTSTATATSSASPAIPETEKTLSPAF